MSTLVPYQMDNSVATISMDDGKFNALSLAMFSELGAALDRAADDRAVVVLTGREGIFSAGFDPPALRGGGPPAAALLHAGFWAAAPLRALPPPAVVASPGAAAACGAC